MTLDLHVIPARPEDAGCGVARLDPSPVGLEEAARTVVEALGSVG